MFHTAVTHGHARWPPISSPDHPAEERQFDGSVQPAVFDRPRVWSDEVRDVVEKCLMRIAIFGVRLDPGKLLLGYLLDSL